MANTRNLPRLRRSQLATPGVDAKMLAKAAASAADHVFCDLEDAVAPREKPAARSIVAKALKELDWGRKVRCVRINDVDTQWCFEDIIEIVETAGEFVDTIMLPKAKSAADVHFVDRLLSQLESKLGLRRRIGLEILIEEAEGLQNVESIAAASDRNEALIFGMGDYSASQRIDVKQVGGETTYPGDIFHYARFRIAMAARAAGLEPIDGPFGNFRNREGYEREARRAASLGMAGKWAIHPNQIEPALEIFSPSVDDVAMARKTAGLFEQALKDGVGSINVDGVMVDIASARIFANILSRADQIGM